MRTCARARATCWNVDVDHTGVLDDLYGRLPPLALGAVDGLSVEELTHAPVAGANPIAWLVWHTARVQDHHFAELRSIDQLWTQGDWAARFGLAADPDNTGYGHDADEVRTVVPTSGADLTGYLDAVHTHNAGWLASLSSVDLDAIVDRRWNPPVTMGVRLVSVADDGLQHLGQAAYVRGILAR